ncbi:MAG: IS21-like element helper ATPase IstB [Acidobacteriota bacterium]
MNSEVLTAQIKLYAKELKMPGLAVAFEEIARDASKAGRSHLEALAACLAAEVVSRTEHRLAARLKGARFPALKSFEGFDFTLAPSLEKARVLALGTGEFIAAKENVVCLGGSGTGKTHIATAIGLAAIYAGARVRFIGAISLAQELLAAADEHRLPRYLKGWQRAELVIVDELGYLPLGPGAPLLFQFFAERYEAGSVLVTSNLEFSRWSEVFGDATLTAALLDRFTHHSHILVFEGESYRFRESSGQI